MTAANGMQLAALRAASDAEVVTLAPELEGHQDEKPRLKPTRHAALDKGCDEVARRLRLERDDLLDIGVGKESLPALVQLDYQARCLGPEGFEGLVLVYLQNAYWY